MELIQHYLNKWQPSPSKKAHTKYGQNGYSAGCLNDGIKEVDFGYTSMQYEVLQRNFSVYPEMENVPSVILGPRDVNISMRIAIDNNDIHNVLRFGYGKPMVLEIERLKSTVYLHHIEFNQDVGDGELYANVTFRATDDFQLL